MKFPWIVSVIALLVFCALFAEEPAPYLPSKVPQWLDGKAHQWEDFKGRVVMLNVWTFGCWNSYRSLPWVAGLQKQFPDLQIIGIHSPEFDYEKDRTKMREVMAQYNISYPQILDDDYVYWRQLNNRYWPSFYIVDKQGKIRGKFAGETHAGDSQAKRIESLIEALRKE